MRIGIDFDNTIACYDAVFLSTARDRGWVDQEFTGTKIDVRDKVRKIPNGEVKWQVLQGLVYGRLMGQAVLIEGVADFLVVCREKGLAVYVISHKTIHANHDPDKVDLRAAARDWMETQGLLSPDACGIPPENVFFEATRSEKIDRISKTGCTHFIDDLEEVFREPDFPQGVERYLLAVGEGTSPSGPFKSFRTWPEITDDLFRVSARAD